MSGQDYEQLSLFPGDSPVSRSAVPGSAEARMMTVISGQKCLESSTSSGPLGLLEKTLLTSSIWRSTKCYLTWKTRATKQERLLFRLAASTPRTGGTDAPSWPTPTASDWRRRGPNSHQQGLPEAVQMWPTPRANKVGGYSTPSFRPTLEQTVKEDAARMWPTPNSCKASMDISLKKSGDGRAKPNKLGWAVALWPTPTGRCGAGASQTATRQGGPDLQTAAQMYPTPTTGAGLCGGTGNYQQLKALEASGQITEEERRSMAAGNGGQLNPTWVEWLMGFPLGWTDLSASETP